MMQMMTETVENERRRLKPVVWMWRNASPWSQMIGEMTQKLK